MTDSGEFKAIVHERMNRTGENYTTAYRAILKGIEVTGATYYGEPSTPVPADASASPPSETGVGDMPSVSTRLEELEQGTRQRATVAASTR
jgi:hypothetical protein